MAHSAHTSAITSPWCDRKLVTDVLSQGNDDDRAAARSFMEISVSRPSSDDPSHKAAAVYREWADASPPAPPPGRPISADRGPRDDRCAGPGRPGRGPRPGLLRG